MRKKVLSFLCSAIVMASSVIAPVMPYCSMTAFAAQQGNITIDSVNSSDKYDLYKLMDAVTSNTVGSAGDVTDGSSVAGDFGSVTYTVNAKYLDALKAAIDAVNGEEEGAPANEKAVVDYIEGLDGNASDLAKFSRAVYEEVSSLEADKKDVMSDTPTAVDYGYYLIVDASGDDDADLSDTILISAITGNRTITPKTDNVPVLTKKIVSDTGEVDADSAYTGDVVNFRITVSNLPKEDGMRGIVVHDTMDGLTLNGNPTVKIGRTVLTEDVEYTVNKNDGDCSLAFAFNDEELKGLTNDDIVIEYSAIVDNDALIGGVGNTNKAAVEYKNSFTADSTSLTTYDETAVYTFRLNVTKVDSVNTDKKLQGAQFKLYSDATAVTEIKVVKSGTEYIVDEDAAQGVAMETDANGNIVVKGLKDGTYYLKEISAPAGYALPEKDTVKIVVTGTYYDGTNANDYTENDGHNVMVSFDADQAIGDPDAADGPAFDAEEEIAVTTPGIIPIQITNTAGAALPETGGMGTYAFYAIGGGLMVIAAAVVVASKKKKN